MRYLEQKQIQIKYISPKAFALQVAFQVDERKRWGFQPEGGRLNKIDCGFHLSIIVQENRMDDNE